MKNYSISPEEAAAELLRRRRSRNSLLDFTKHIEVPGKPVSDADDEWLFTPVETGIADHHLMILSVMQRVIDGSLPRAMFFLPPGSAKSTYGSVVSPAWAMGKFPGLKIILSSYGSDLARRHGRRARQIVKQPQYQAIFGTKLSSDTAAADEWALTNGSEYVACGILSGITGHRAHGIIIDDPIKGRQEADSETVRERTWSVYQEDLRTRLIPGGWEIVIQTRWHESDLSGRLLPEEYEGESGLIRCRDGRDWYVVCLPAQCDRHDDPIGRKVGDYLWPEWFVPGHFEPFQSQPRTWNALFQQRPQPEEGTFFQRAWFKRYRQGEQPRFLHIYGSSDYATGDNEGDYTDHAVLGVDETGDIWVLDWWHKQATTDVWIDTQLDLIKTWAPFCWFEEAGVIKKAIRPFQERRMQERGIYCRHEWIPPVANKPTRARGFQARAAAGKVHVPEGEIGDLIIDQFIRFPTGAHDDAVDTMSTFCMALDQAHPAIVQTQRKPKLQSDARIDFIEEQLPADEYEMSAFHNQIENVRFWEGYARQHVYGETYSPHEGGRTYGDVDGR
ncbi:MAG: phage terminase large subunit [Spirochaetota bacterium]